jgi:hypothetical protein
MAVQIPPEVASSICSRIRDENRDKPLDLQALQCRNCEACCSGLATKAGGRACCLIRQRYARTVVIAV